MTTIPSRPLARSGISLTELGFGASGLGGLNRPVSSDEAAATLRTALDAGVGYFDTGPYYGRGLSERRVGDALRGRPDVRISTKVGRLLHSDASVIDDRARDGFHSPMPFAVRHDYSHDGILRSHEHSLQRLGLPRVDLLYIHDIGAATHGAAAADHWAQLTEGGGLRALQRLKDDGSIAGFGAGVNEIAVCLDLLRECPIDCFLLANRYTLLEQDALDTLLPACLAAGTSVVIGAPYNSGILATGVATTTASYDYAPAPAAIVNRVRRIEAVAARHAVPLAAAALQFVLAHPAVCSVIPGIDSPARAQQTVDLYHTPIPPDFWRELRAERLLRADAPVPGDRP